MLCIHEEPQPPKEFGTYLLYIKMSRRDHPSGLFYLATKYYYNFVFLQHRYLLFILNFACQIREDFQASL